MTVYAATFTDAQAEVVDKVRLDANLDATRVANWLNQTLANVAAQTGYFTGSSAGSALVAGATNQALPASLIDLDYLTCGFGGQTVFMQSINFDRMLQLRSTSAGASGPPYFYYLDKNTVEVFPTAAGGEILTYYGATYPIVWTGAAVSGLPEPYGSKLLIYGACVEAADYKNDARIYTYYQQAYQQWMGQFLTFLNQRRTENSRAWPVYGPDGRPFGSPFLPHDPSSDYYVTGLRS